MGVIQFKNVGKVFGPKESGFVALKDINLEIADKEFVAIVGPSGCGKTTCLRLVSGFDNPTDGAVMVDGTPIKRPGPNRAVVFQQFALFPWKSVYDNIDIGLRNLSVPKAERQSRIAAILNLMNLEPYAEHFPHQLSGGMQQRVAIARAYVLDPDVLLMDEPFGALDAQTRVVMQEELVRLARKNPRTVLFITHAVEEAVYLADRVVIMTRAPGRIKEVLDIASIRKAEDWDSHEKIEDVMDLESFVHLRTQIWRSLREEKADQHA
ncbi:ABC transporter ATP-binding protein [Seohaeicola sp. SP36]|uniref:ABC transporter ATP-binding protein n=1 Tax=unclassified Seohaeicola TaxID=2641111 RepID=UPI00237ACC81|nr:MULTISPECIES: ABC transporter ATP-binding protein [unclassified Seohaeicola]MDD9706975.1 ABC transporter ATP-binding protein [Seohaeicola sp. 4SK31]MDD9734085.1 ABC transporter ATP-binding protein [Seohaeicola sp. SP36]